MFACQDRVRWLSSPVPTPQPPSTPPPRTGCRGASQDELEVVRLGLARGPEGGAPAEALLQRGSRSCTQAGAFPPGYSSCLARSCLWWTLATHNPVFMGGKKPSSRHTLGDRRTLFALHVSFHMGTPGTLATFTWSEDFASTLAVSTIIQNLMSYVKTQTVVGE